MFIVLVGNPIDGMTPRGPFETAEEGNDWAQENRVDEYFVTEVFSQSVDYVVTVKEAGLYLNFECEADSQAHAMEQAQNAYPNGLAISASEKL